VGEEKTVIWGKAKKLIRQLILLFILFSLNIFLINFKFLLIF